VVLQPEYDSCRTATKNNPRELGAHHSSSSIWWPCSLPFIRACHDAELDTFVCAFFLGAALLRGGLASIGPADGEAATQEFAIGPCSGKAYGFPPGALTPALPALSMAGRP
jgi:hypothetical protein